MIKVRSLITKGDLTETPDVLKSPSGGFVVPLETLLESLIDKNRFLSATSNNPQSSRSHVISSIYFPGFNRTESLAEWGPPRVAESVEFALDGGAGDNPDEKASAAAAAVAAEEKTKLPSLYIGDFAGVENKFDFEYEYPSSFNN